MKFLFLTLISIAHQPFIQNWNRFGALGVAILTNCRLPGTTSLLHSVSSRWRTERSLNTAPRFQCSASGVAFGDAISNRHRCSCSCSATIVRPCAKQCSAIVHERSASCCVRLGAFGPDSNRFPGRFGAWFGLHLVYSTVLIGYVLWEKCQNTLNTSLRANREHRHARALVLPARRRLLRSRLRH